MAYTIFRMLPIVPVLGLFFAGNWPLRANEPPDTKPDAKAAADKSEPPTRTVEELARSCRDSVVVITVTGRDGTRQGLGTGFVVSADGLIATNLHVIDTGRPISVQTVDGKRHEVTHVEAIDRPLDLALVRIDAKGLPVLQLGDSDTLQDGQAVVSLGNPHGLRHSVVSGLVSGKREIDGRPMIQLAIPIEPGNSGGPLLDMQGRVHGILTMKSLVTANLGFAVAINSLKPLIARPNPVAMSRWLTIGSLDPKEWSMPMGADWRQRAGRIQVRGAGDGFGGRALCLFQVAPPEVPYEVAVLVKLDDEGGAAGLVFNSDGKDRHYGFYPTAGKLRLTRFDGPDVYSWKILSDQACPQYKPGEWNTLKVRVEEDKLSCYVNGVLAVESTDRELTGGKVGLAKFRQTEAEFKGFQLAREIPAQSVPEAVVKRVSGLVSELPNNSMLKPELIEKLLPDSTAGVSVLRERAESLEQQAVQLRKLAKAVHERNVQDQLAELMQDKESQIDLVRAGLLIARLDNDELDMEAYLRQFERLARELRESLPKDADDEAKLSALNKLMFAEHGFHGSRADYYNRSNSYLNEVLDDREGLPITLAVIYMELARRVGLHVEGVGLPGHFVVKHLPAKGEPRLIDVYEGGQALPREKASEWVMARFGRPLEESDLTASSKQAIVVRMLYNLRGLAEDQKDTDGVMRYIDTILAVAPQSHGDRSLRVVLRAQSGDKAGALADIDWFLKHEPEGIDLERVREFRRMLE